ncbi:MAG: TIGR04376 family protein [Halothece sp.]
MSLLDDLTKFLETRLDEFLKNNPHLELQALEEQLREEEKETIRLILDLQKQEKKLENEILSIAEDVKLWHQRIDKAKAANREDLVKAAQEKEASLLRIGNQRWGQMKAVKEKIQKAKDLIEEIRKRQKEVKAKAREARANQQAANTNATSGWKSAESYYQQGMNYSSYQSRHAFDDLEEKFRNWEVEEELKQMKEK